jgi:periplasmic divalent cation tolerance protein
MTEQPAVCEVVITAPDAEWLAEFTRRLVADRLCAAGHVIAPIRSLYRWRGELYDREEARVALHTRASLVPAIVERTQHEHPYEVPCVIAMPISAGNLDYLAWVLSETGGPPEVSPLSPHSA